MIPPAWFRDLGGADPYQLLRVTSGATAGEITRAYRQRIRELHPDRASGDTEEARLANLARDILLDPVRRAEYDRLAAGPEYYQPYPAADPPAPSQNLAVAALGRPEPVLADPGGQH